MKQCDVSSEVSAYTCLKVDRPPVIDGRLDDDAWKAVPEMRLVLAEDGRPTAQATKAKMCWDDDNLYVAFDCVDEDIWATLTRHDDPIYREEVVEIFIDPGSTLTRHFEFVLNPLNVLFDAKIHQELGSLDIDINAEWECEGFESAVFVDGTLDDRTDTDRGWSSEMKIPFASMGFQTPRPGEQWLANLYRIDLSPEPAEFMAWSPTLYSPPRFHVPMRFGRIMFDAE